MVPRYNVKVNVDDRTGQAVFALFDLEMYNLIDKKCTELFIDDKVDDEGSYPAEFDLLVGLELLFQVEKRLTSDIQFDGTFSVKRVCDHEIIIAKFDAQRFDNNYEVVSSRIEISRKLMAFNNRIAMGSSSSEMDEMFDILAAVNPDRDSWYFKVRVIRLWTLYSATKPGHLNSLEMIVIDEKGTKIHASIPHKLLYLFRHKIFEGSVYKMSNFKVALEEGVNRTTSHPYQLHFLYKTKVDRCEDCSIEMLGLSLTTIGNIRSCGPNHEFLVDVAGLVMRTSSEREFVRDGKTTKEVMLQMFDNSGNCECSFNLQKIRYEEGKFAVESYLNVTRIMINPSIPEIIAFKERLAIVGVVCVGPHTRPSLDEDFLIRNPPISIANLCKTNREGFYIIGGIIDSLVEPEQWWYPACSFHASLSSNASGFYCNICDKDVTHMIPMFKLKLTIKDGTGQEVFILFEQEMYELLGKHCYELLTVHEGDNSHCYPLEFDILIGRKLLLKIEKSKIDGYDIFDHPFRVERICQDLSLIDAFDSPFLNEASDSQDDE
ncbi:hypothetical protein P8452_64933 [Trifolium repens]|nr:hypothetical protein P8452_64933 [Trifolium repens]